VRKKRKHALKAARDPYYAKARAIALKFTGHRRAFHPSHKQRVQSTKVIIRLVNCPGAVSSNKLSMAASQDVDELPFELTTTDRQNLTQGDENFQPHTWDELKDIIGITYFDHFLRAPC